MVNKDHASSEMVNMNSVIKESVHFRKVAIINLLFSILMQKRNKNLFNISVTLQVAEMQQLYNICDPIFCKVIDLYEVETIVAIGKFCETRAAKALKKHLPSNNIKVKLNSLYFPLLWPSSLFAKLGSVNILGYKQSLYFSRVFFLVGIYT